jgi:hypothetical protein
MVTSGFGPHHGLMWLDATPTKCIGIMKFDAMTITMRAINDSNGYQYQ